MAEEPDVRLRAFETGLQPPVAILGEPETRWSLEERMAHHKVPGLSVAVIRNGRLAWAKGYGVKQAGSEERVDAQTLFSTGSVSKVSSAVLTLRLVDAGKIDLDRDVNAYLKRWQVPSSPYTANRPVTVRGILSHMAGLNVPGFPDFLPDEKLPTLLDTLEGRPPSKTPAVRVVQTPGIQERYSGGGITVEQLLIEEVTNLDFPVAAKQWLFEPLGMSRSTYQNPLPASIGNIAKAHDAQGQPTALPRGWETMPEMAASGLWTTPSDFAKLIIALMESYRGQPASFLQPATAHQMMEQVGVSAYGLGPQLDGIGAMQRFYHSGSNNSYQALMEGHPARGSGVVIFTNGTNGSALIAEVYRAIADAEGWPFGGAVRVARFVPSALDEVTGTYESRPVSTFAAGRALSPVPAYEVWRENEHLVFGRSRRDFRRLIPVGPLQFVTDNGLRQLEFVRGYDGRIEGLILRRGIYHVEAVRRSAEP